MVAKEKKKVAPKATKTAAPKKKEPAKTVAKKAPAKKPSVKKEAVKKAAPKKVNALKTVQEYIDVINWKKWEAHNMGWLYIEINADDLLTELEAGKKNIDTTCKAILNTMLEGDAFIVEPKGKTKVSSTLTVRYYVDNLSPERQKYQDVCKK